MPESKHRRRRARGRASPSGGGSRRAQGNSAPIHPRRRKTNWWMLAASGVVAVLVIAGFVVGDMAGIFQGGGGTADDYVDGIGEPHQLMPTANHVPEGQTVEYSTVPPTSGDHWTRWANCGFYEQEVPNERTVHNLEHGNIVVNYNLNAEGVAQLQDVLSDIGQFNTNGLAKLYSEIPEGTVALAAWGVSDVMEGVDEERIQEFFGAYAGSLGPERISCLGTGVNP